VEDQEQEIPLTVTRNSAAEDLLSLNHTDDDANDSESETEKKIAAIALRVLRQMNLGNNPRRSRSRRQRPEVFYDESRDARILQKVSLRASSERALLTHRRLQCERCSGGSSA
jgi:hypothetical protein